MVTFHSRLARLPADLASRRFHVKHRRLRPTLIFRIISANPLTFSVSVFQYFSIFP